MKKININNDDWISIIRNKRLSPMEDTWLKTGVKIFDGSMASISELRDRAEKFFAEREGITNDDLKSKKRKTRINSARQMIMNMLYENTNGSLGEIGAFYNRDHSTVVHAKKNVYNLPVSKKAMAYKYKDLLLYCGLHRAADIYNKHISKSPFKTQYILHKKTGKKFHSIHDAAAEFKVTAETVRRNINENRFKPLFEYIYE